MRIDVLWTVLLATLFCQVNCMKPSNQPPDPKHPSSAASAASGGQSPATAPASQPSGPVDARGARAIAEKTVAALAINHDYVLMDDQTVERPFGWVFFYTTREYLKTRDPQHLVPGTAPFVVHRRDGSIEHLATSLPPKRAIDLYEERWNEQQRQATTKP
ncbi:MAG: YrhB domain-containing protein [Phycisphaerae bacterium]